MFDPATAAAAARHTSTPPAARRIPAEAYKAFRGRLPTPEALLRKRGLIEAPAAAS